MYSLDNVGRNIIAMVLAGGKGERLGSLALPLAALQATLDRSSLFLFKKGSHLGFKLLPSL